MSISVADTHAKLIDLALYALGGKEEYIKREETVGAVEMRGGKAYRRSHGRIPPPIDEQKKVA